MEIHVETFFVTLGGRGAEWIIFYFISKYLISVFVPEKALNLYFNIDK